MQFPKSERVAVELQKRLLREAAAFIVNDQIPAFVSVMMFTFLMFRFLFLNLFINCSSVVWLQVFILMMHEPFPDTCSAVCMLY